jgi:hypothetical protein
VSRIEPVTERKLVVAVRRIFALVVEMVNRHGEVVCGVERREVERREVERREVLRTSPRERGILFGGQRLGILSRLA